MFITSKTTGITVMNKESNKKLLFVSFFKNMEQFLNSDIVYIDITFSYSIMYSDISNLKKANFLFYKCVNESLSEDDDVICNVELPTEIEFLLRVDKLKPNEKIVVLMDADNLGIELNYEIRVLEKVL